MSSSTVIPRPAALRRRDWLVRLGPLFVSIAGFLAVAALWRSQLFPINLVGEAQTSFNRVSSLESGKLVDLQVGLHATVTNGQILGHVQVRAPDSIQASIDSSQADLEVMRVRLLQDQERNDLNRAQMQHDLIQRRLDLVATRIRLRQAESEFARVQRLIEEGVLAAGVGSHEDGYDVALRDRDLLTAEVGEKEKLVLAMEESLREVGHSPAAGRLEQIHSAIDAAIQAQERRLHAAQEPVVLRASIDGMVTKINRHPGENVGAGESLLEIWGTQPEWILGFVRQPISFQPRTNDLVRVLTRGRPRRSAEARIRSVGAHLENFTQPLRVRGFDASLERGLPILLEYPSSLGLKPGELVDLVPLGHP